MPHITVWARQQETPNNLGKPEILIGALSSNNLDHMLTYIPGTYLVVLNFSVEFTNDPFFLINPIS